MVRIASANPQLLITISAWCSMNAKPFILQLLTTFITLVPSKLTCIIGRHRSLHIRSCCVAITSVAVQTLARLTCCKASWILSQLNRFPRSSLRANRQADSVSDSFFLLLNVQWFSCNETSLSWQDYKLPAGTFICLVGKGETKPHEY